MLAILSVGTLVFSQCDKSSNVACKRRVRKSHGENLVSPGKLDARGGLELSSTWNNTTRNRELKTFPDYLVSLIMANSIILSQAVLNYF